MLLSYVCMQVEDEFNEFARQSFIVLDYSFCSLQVNSCNFDFWEGDASTNVL